jgi:hypothetical protein
MLGQFCVPDEFELDDPLELDEPAELELPVLAVPDPLDVEVGVLEEELAVVTADPLEGDDELVEAVAAEIPRPRLNPTAVTPMPAIA